MGSFDREEAAKCMYLGSQLMLFRLPSVMRNERNIDLFSIYLF